jgi:short-subunit dehydrogenase involved in D-alanine esterification of teichoic acids
VVLITGGANGLGLQLVLQLVTEVIVAVKENHYCSQHT